MPGLAQMISQALGSPTVATAIAKALMEGEAVTTRARSTIATTRRRGRRAAQTPAAIAATPAATPERRRGRPPGAAGRSNQYAEAVRGLTGYPMPSEQLRTSLGWNPQEWASRSPGLIKSRILKKVGDNYELVQRRQRQQRMAA